MPVVILTYLRGWWQLKVRRYVHARSRDEAYSHTVVEFGLRGTTAFDPGS